MVAHVYGSEAKKSVTIRVTTLPLTHPTPPVMLASAIAVAQTVPSKVPSTKSASTTALSLPMKSNASIAKPVRK